MAHYSDIHRRRHGRPPPLYCHALMPRHCKLPAVCWGLGIRCTLQDFAILPLPCPVAHLLPAVPLHIALALSTLTIEGGFATRTHTTTALRLAASLCGTAERASTRPAAACPASRSLAQSLRTPPASSLAPAYHRTTKQVDTQHITACDLRSKGPGHAHEAALSSSPQPTSHSYARSSPRTCSRLPQLQALCRIRRSCWQRASSRS